MIHRQEAAFMFDYDNLKGFHKRYGLWEPLATGYNDPPEQVALGEGMPQFFLPPEAMEYLAVVYLRHHGYYVASPRDIKFTAILSPEGREGYPWNQTRAAGPQEER